MPVFFFDHRDCDKHHPDDQGTDCRDIVAARLEATRALGEFAKDALPGSERREIAIEVSDENRRPLFRTALWFEIQDLSSA
jgi:hypothetical protein